ncbi:MAG TPA: hypothetical protein ENJ08_14145 [Gammaproteobacteria bacterium]|nr:hypothetical protein [Gammaproteobacteria bacterium]
MLSLLVMITALVLTAYFSFMTKEAKLLKSTVTGLFIVSLLLTHIIPLVPFIWIIGLIMQAAISVSLITYIKIKGFNL